MLSLVGELERVISKEREIAITTELFTNINKHEIKVIE